MLRTAIELIILAALLTAGFMVYNEWQDSVTDYKAELARRDSVLVVLRGKASSLEHEMHALDSLFEVRVDSLEEESADARSRVTQTNAEFDRQIEAAAAVATDSMRTVLQQLQILHNAEVADYELIIENKNEEISMLYQRIEVRDSLLDAKDALIRQLEDDVEFWQEEAKPGILDTKIGKVATHVGTGVLGYLAGKG